MIELAQVRVFHLQQLEWWDIRDDTIGVAIAFAAWLAWKLWPRRSRPQDR
jgi:hypothetical protein